MVSSRNGAVTCNSQTLLVSWTDLIHYKTMVKIKKETTKKESIVPIKKPLSKKSSTTTKSSIAKRSIKAKKKITKTNNPVPKGLKEYRLVIAVMTDQGLKKKQGPRLCNVRGEKLYFQSKCRAKLGVWVHDARMLPKGYSASVIGHTYKRGIDLEYKVTFEEICKQVAKMNARPPRRGKPMGAINLDILASVAATVSSF